jgi:hypothetical protein
MDALQHVPGSPFENSKRPGAMAGRIATLNTSIRRDVASVPIIGAVSVPSRALAYRLADVVLLTVSPKLQGALARAQLKLMMRSVVVLKQDSLETCRIASHGSSHYTVDMLGQKWLKMVA